MALIGSHEAIIFRRIPKDAVGNLAIDTLRADVRFTEGDRGLSGPRIILDSTSAVEVELLLNPYEVTMATAKEIQKTRTLSRGRYVIQDWGPDLTVVTLRMQTGNLLPYTFPPLPAPIVPRAEIEGTVLTSIPQDITSFDARGYINPNAVGEAAENAQRFGYTGLLLASPKFLTFLSFCVLYHEFDANNEVLLMTFSRGIFRGYLTNWTFTIDANSPWNWKYSADFVIIQGLDSFIGGTLTNQDTFALLRSVQALDTFKPENSGIAAFFDDTVSPIFSRL